MSIQALEVAFRSALNPQPLLGKLGYVVNGVASVQTSDPALYNVRLDDGRFITAYHNNAVAPDFDRSVKLMTEVRDGKQVFVILGVAGGSDGGNPGVSAHSHSRASGMYFEVDSWLISGFRVTVGDIALTVHVGPGWYWYAGARYWFTGTVIDFSPEVPGSSNQHCWSTLSFNPADETFSLTTSTAQSVALTLLESNIPAAPDDERELVALKLTNGMTELLDSYIVDMRSILGRVDHLHSGAVSVITISGGVAVGGLGSYFVLAAETGTADDLDTLTLSGPARMIILQADAGDTIAAKHNTGNVKLNGAADFSLSGDKTLALFWDGTNLADVGAGSSFSGDAFAIPYTATTPADWSAAPTNAGEALDTIAADFTALVGGGFVQSVVGGTNTSVDNTDPFNPIVNSLSSPGGGAPPSICEGRLTLTSGTPITTTDVTAAGTLYFTPFRGNYIGLYDGASAWELKTFSELSISLSGLVPHSLHDVFIYNNSGTPTLELAAWNAGATAAITGATNATPIVITSTAHGLSTGDVVTISGVGGNTAANGTFRITNTGANTFSLQTLAAGGANVAGSGAYTSGGDWYKANYSGTRATALTTQDGIYVKTGATTRRYLGTIRITSTAGQCEDSYTRRFVWNLHNREQRILKVTEAGNSWSYTTTTYRAINNNWQSRAEIVVGLDLAPPYFEARIWAVSTGGGVLSLGVGLNSTTTTSTFIMNLGYNAGVPLQAVFANYTGEGYHYLQLLEYGSTGGTFYGDFGAPTIRQSGGIGWIWG